MSMPSPPQPAAYTVAVTPPNTPTPRPERRITPPAFSSPVATKFSPQHEQLQSTSPVTPNLLLPSDGGTKLGSPVRQFSSPPGPPVFSSPLRPTTAPFRASPDTPQSVAYQSSMQPPSSSSHYSTESTELREHASSEANTSTVGETTSYVLFSCNKVPKFKKIANISSLGFGALISPGKEISQGPLPVQRDPHRCVNCGAYANLYCSIVTGSGKWQCVICKHLNGSEVEYEVARMEDLRGCPEFSSPVLDYIQTGNKKPGFFPLSETRLSTSVFLVIDECLDEAHLQHLQSSLHAFVDSLSATTRVGIITYGRTVSVYDFSEGSTASADILPGNRSPTKESLKALIYGTGIYLAPIHASLPVAHSIFSSLRPYERKFPEASRDRCLGTAVEVALAIIHGPSSELAHGMGRRSGGNCRILVCSGGPNTYGPGSVPHLFTHPNYPYMEKAAKKWFEQLGSKAHHHGIFVDILCAGNCPVRVSVLQPLAKASGGVFLLHDDFGEAFGVNLQRASTRATGTRGMLEVRCSDNILVTHVIGPGEEATSETRETFKDDLATRVQMLSVEETQSFVLSLELKSDIKSDHVFFQFVAHYSNVYRAEISRVITIRLPTVDSVSAYLSGIQGEVATVLIAKRTALLAKSACDAVNMRLAIDERIKDIAARYGSQRPDSKLYQFPKEISFISENLFHLKRGPLLGNILGHEDQRSVLRDLFLNVSFDMSLRMVAPRCLMHREGGTFEELPAYDLALQSDAAVVLDHGTDVFIWLGSELAAQEEKRVTSLTACRTLAEELTEQRFPAPRIMVFKEGSSEARYLLSRLIPAHRDSPFEQEARFPQLRQLSIEQRARLKSSFLNFDELSFCEWMRSLKVVPPDPC